VCIKFKRSSLLKAMKKHPGLRMRQVKIPEARRNKGYDVARERSAVPKTLMPLSMNVNFRWFMSPIQGRRVSSTFASRWPAR
jgi:hypothetical protein